MASKMPLLREPAALACSALRARPRHRVLGASPEGSHLWLRRWQHPHHDDHMLAQHARKLGSYQLANPIWAQRRRTLQGMHPRASSQGASTPSPWPLHPHAAAGRRCSYGKQEGQLVLLGAPLPTCMW